MKTGELAKRLDIHPNTLRSWVDGNLEFFSPDAYAARRRYNRADVVLLATIKELKAAGMTAPEIQAELKKGRRAQAESLAAEAMTPGIVARADLEMVQARVYDLTTQLEAARADLAAEQARVTELVAELGQAKGELAMMKAQEARNERLFRIVVYFAAAAGITGAGLAALAVLALAGRL